MNKNYRSDGKIINFINSNFENLIDSYEEMEFDFYNNGGVYLYNTEDNNDLGNLVFDQVKSSPLKIFLLIRAREDLKK